MEENRIPLKPIRLPLSQQRIERNKVIIEQYKALMSIGSQRTAVAAHLATISNPPLSKAMILKITANCVV